MIDLSLYPLTLLHNVNSDYTNSKSNLCLFKVLMKNTSNTLFKNIRFNIRNISENIKPKAGT